jgi:hypothetical protein
VAEIKNPPNFSPFTPIFFRKLLWESAEIWGHFLILLPVVWSFAFAVKK